MKLSLVSRTCEGIQHLDIGNTISPQWSHSFHQFLAQHYPSAGHISKFCISNWIIVPPVVGVIAKNLIPAALDARHLKYYGSWEEVTNKKMQQELLIDINNVPWSIAFKNLLKHSKLHQNLNIIFCFPTSSTSPYFETKKI